MLNKIPWVWDLLILCSLLFLPGIVLTPQLCKQYLVWLTWNSPVIKQICDSHDFPLVPVPGHAFSLQPRQLKLIRVLAAAVLQASCAFLLHLSACLSTSGPLLNNFSQKTHPKMMYWCVFCWLWGIWRFWQSGWSWPEMGSGSTWWVEGNELACSCS